MTATSSLSAPGSSHTDLRRMWSDAPAFAGLALFLALALMPFYAAMALETRVFQGESPWLKPVKFHYALTIYLITLAFFARYVSDSARASRLWRAFVAVVCGGVIYEVLWIGTAASMNVASHFNDTSLAWGIAFALAGVGAVLLTAGSLGLGIGIARNKATGLAPALHLSIWVGLIVTFVLTVIVAGYLSSNQGHFVGTSTRQLAVLGWSRDAGDLRVAHFLATHALHGLPLVGLIASRTFPASARTIVILAALGYATLVLITFLQAIRGLPFLPFIG